MCKLTESNESIEVISNNFIASEHCIADKAPCYHQEEDCITEDDTVSKDTQEDADRDVYFEIGDHLYSWCSFGVIPYVYQHHGIVVEVSTNKDRIKIVNFGLTCADLLKKNCRKEKNSKPTFSSLGTAYTVWKELNKELNRSRVIKNTEYTIEGAKKKWRKVMYHNKDSLHKVRRFVNAPGTAGIDEADSPGFVVARALFLLHNPEIIPPYHLVKCNCECFAVWCKTGKFSSLQVYVVASVLFTSPALLLPWKALEKISSSSSQKTNDYNENVRLLDIFQKFCGGKYAATTKIFNQEFTKCNLKGKYLPHFTNSNDI